MRLHAGLLFVLFVLSVPVAAALLSLPRAPARADGALWRADAEQPLSAHWAEFSTGPNCAVISTRVRHDPRIVRVRSPRAHGAYAYAVTVRDGDRCFGERAEVGQALPSRPGFSAQRLFREGDDRWISFDVRLGRDFPTDTSAWNLIAQWKQLAVRGATGCCPALALEVRDGHYQLDHDGRTVWVGPRALRSRWVRFLLHIGFSADAANGFVAIWGDFRGVGMRSLLAARRMATLARTTGDRAVPSHARIGIYRDASIRGTAHVYYDDYVVATSRAAAAASAFAPVERSVHVHH
jgi:hypothetical protein